MRLIILLVFVLCAISSQAQPLSAYANFQNEFYVWDNGMLRKVDYLKPVEYKIGRFAIPYLDNSRNFKIYTPTAGNVKLNSGFTNDFQVSDYLITYRNSKSLSVYDNGKSQRLAGIASNVQMGDSLVMFFDNVQAMYKLYYGGEIFELETFLAANNADELLSQNTSSKVVFNNQGVADGQIPSVKVSDNVAAYVNFANRFKIFYHGELLEQETYLIKSFDVGRNMVAYVDINQEFKLFDHGVTKTLEPYQPNNYKVGDNFVAYIAQDNNFKVFYNDSIYNLGNIQPDYKISDYVLYYQDQSGYFKAFYQGQDYNLESYLPTTIVAGYNSIAYLTRGNMLKLFSEGKTYEVTNADVQEWRLDYDVVQYRFGANLYKIFYRGKTY